MNNQSQIIFNDLLQNDSNLKLLEQSKSDALKDVMDMKSRMAFIEAQGRMEDFVTSAQNIVKDEI